MEAATGEAGEAGEGEKGFEEDDIPNFLDPATLW